MTKSLETSFYVILSGAKRYNWRELKAKRIVQKTTSLPKTGVDEVAIRVNVSLPEALFERPELTVSIAVDGAVPRVNIDADTMETLTERMHEILGTPVTITCDLPEIE